MLTSAQQTQYNLAGGLIAGMAAAVISQPADTLLSKINKTKGAPGQSTTSRLVQMAGQLGAKGLFTGMSARLVMIGTLTAGQCESFLSFSQSWQARDPMVSCYSDFLLFSFGLQALIAHLSKKSVTLCDLCACRHNLKAYSVEVYTAWLQSPSFFLDP